MAAAEPTTDLAVPTPAQSKKKKSTTLHDWNAKFSLKDRVEVEGYDCKGRIRWLGTLPGEEKPKLGIELDEPVGKHNGTLKGFTAFECGPKRGIFAPLSKVTHGVVKVKVRVIPALPGIKVGARCFLDKYQCEGTVKWVGTLPREREFKVGVQLDKPVGKNSGVVRQRYRLFRCKPNTGVLTSPDKIVLKDRISPDHVNSGGDDVSNASEDDSAASAAARQRGRRESYDHVDQMIADPDMIVTRRRSTSYCEATEVILDEGGLEDDVEEDGELSDLRDDGEDSDDELPELVESDTELEIELAGHAV